MRRRFGFSGFFKEVEKKLIYPSGKCEVRAEVSGACQSREVDCLVGEGEGVL